MKLLPILILVLLAGCTTNQSSHVSLQKSNDAKEVYYYPNGQLRFSAKRDNNGRFDGEVVGFWPSGSIQEESYWVDGKIIEGKYWDSDGKLRSEVIEGTGTRILIYEGHESGFESFYKGEYTHGGG